MEQVMDPNLVRGDQWQEFFEIYVQDKFKLEMNAWFEQVDPKAQKAIIEHMLEANRKEYWQASDETLKTLMERYEQLVNQFDLVVENEKLREFLQNQAQGFGLDITLPAPEVAALATDIAQAQQVEGQKLEKVEPVATSERNLWHIYLITLACCLFFAFGVWRQHRWTPQQLANV